jgi:hypothetical protein
LKDGKDGQNEDEELRHQLMTNHLESYVASALQGQKPTYLWRQTSILEYQIIRFPKLNVFFSSFFSKLQTVSNTSLVDERKNGFD